MKRQIQNNKGSLYSVIPAEIVDDMGLKPGDTLDFKTKNGKIIAEPCKKI